MKQRCIIVTGAGGSIGAAITRTLVSKGHHVIMACRNVEKDTPLRDEINASCDGRATIFQLDLSSLDSVAAFVHRIAEGGYKIDALINNAGVMRKHYGTTAEGYEMTIGTNFVGTYLLTRLLLPYMADYGNIVFTTSLTRYIGKVDKNFYDITAENYGRFRSYSRSKLATTLFAAHLACELRDRGICVNAADPGVVDSGMIHMDAWFDPIADRIFRPLISTPQQGALSALTAADTVVTGEIFEKQRHHPIPKRLRSHPCLTWLIEETDRRLAKWIEK